MPSVRRTIAAGGAPRVWSRTDWRPELGGAPHGPGARAPEPEAHGDEARRLAHRALATRLADTFFGADGEVDRAALRALGETAAAGRRDAGAVLAGVLEGPASPWTRWWPWHWCPWRRWRGPTSPRSQGAPGGAGRRRRDRSGRGGRGAPRAGWLAGPGAECGPARVLGGGPGGDLRRSERGIPSAAGRSHGSSARLVAEAAGGFLGVGTVSRQEEEVLARLESAFTPRAQ